MQGGKILTLRIGAVLSSLLALHQLLDGDAGHALVQRLRPTAVVDALEPDFAGAGRAFVGFVFVRAFLVVVPSFARLHRGALVIVIVVVVVVSSAADVAPVPIVGVVMVMVVVLLLFLRGAPPSAPAPSSSSSLTSSLAPLAPRPGPGPGPGPALDVARVPC